MPKPVADRPLNARLYPEGGPGRQLKARLRAFLPSHWRRRYVATKCGRRRPMNWA